MRVPAPGRRELTTAAWLLALFALVYVGYRRLWFLTDDAFIAFRYVANLVSGTGLTWNPAPFVPVEGYTSLSWVLLLAAVWQLAGIEPPVAANPLGFAFGCVTLLLLYRMLLRMKLPAAWEARRRPLALVALFAVGSNHCFLTWLSSGLETSLFNCALTWWTLEASTREEDRGPYAALRLSASATFVALTRPDGLLLLAPTALLVGVQLARRERSRRALLLQSLPLLLVPLHLLVRRAYYGAWLPNTYYAKAGAWWPQSGLRYLASFVVEYGFWLWLLPAVVWGATRARRRVRWQHVPLVLTVVTLGAHVAYYTLAIGGDYFEYRVYSHLIALGFVAQLWLAARLSPRIGHAYAAVIALWACALPLPWLHDHAVEKLDSRRQTAQLAVPLAGYFPQPLRAAVAHWDGWQAWLVQHSVATRRKELDVFRHFVAAGLADAGYPSRARGAELGRKQRVVIVSPCVGVIGWTLPNAVILDAHGLNDRVIARSAHDPAHPGERRMARERTPPPGYIECLRPALQHTCARLRPLPPRRPVRDAEVRDCEANEW